MYWSGDFFLWENLVKHYIYCAVNHYLRAMHSESDEEIPTKVHVFFTIHDVEPEIRDICIEASSKVLSQKTIKDYIKLISTGNRVVYRHELLAHLKTMHPYIFSVVKDTLIHHDWLQYNGTKRLSQADYLDIVQFHLDNIPKVVNATIEEIFTTVALIMEQDEFANCLINSKFYTDKVHYFMYSGFPGAFCKALNSLMMNDWYTACFMSECSDSSLWGTYGDSHRGLCLKYKAEKKGTGYTIPLRLPTHMRNGQIRTEYVDAELEKMSYTSKHEQANFFHSMDAVSDHDLEAYWYTGSKDRQAATIITKGRSPESVRQTAKAVMLTKMDDWRKENEYRLILSPNTFSLEDKNDRFVTYPAESLDGVIFGINTPIAIKAKVAQILAKICHESGAKINVYQAKYDDESGKITHEKLNKQDLVTILPK